MRIFSFFSYTLYLFHSLETFYFFFLHIIHVARLNVTSEDMLSFTHGATIHVNIIIATYVRASLVQNNHIVPHIMFYIYSSFIRCRSIQWEFQYLYWRLLWDWCMCLAASIITTSMNKTKWASRNDNNKKKNGDALTRGWNGVGIDPFFSASYPYIFLKMWHQVRSICEISSSLRILLCLNSRHWKPLYLFITLNVENSSVTFRPEKGKKSIYIQI